MCCFLRFRSLYLKYLKTFCYFNHFEHFKFFSANNPFLFLFFSPTVYQSMLPDKIGHGSTDHLVKGVEWILCLSKRSVAAAQVGSCSSSYIFLLSRERLEDTRGTECLTTGFDGLALAPEVDVEGVSSSPIKDKRKKETIWCYVRSNIQNTTFKLVV